ncbi:uncharacterized protein LOC128880506 isoform X1 [Hylaeus volcanicus]|uniref:uncharacterized protein LOC128880506 isoform X1 n=2 Tax=Hylaeus volcanicus TaxID=313075 RepID=UPI0023B847DF|nr:uncharacterized protein LOC128880506 isoform X1 [Hylaeus volcanicus]
MSRKVLRRVHLFSLTLLLPIFCKGSYSAIAEDCKDFDIDVLEDYLSKLNLENVPTIAMMIGGFQCPVTTLPFGALKSDWARLMLLQRAQPQESILKEKLSRLFRILAIAYFQIEERFDFTENVSRTTSINASTTREIPSSDHSKKSTEKPNLHSKKTPGIPGSFSPTTVLGTEEFIDATKIEGTAFTSPYVTGEDGERDFFVRIRNGSSTTIASSPVGIETTFPSTIVEQIVNASKNVSGLDNFFDSITVSTLETSTLNNGSFDTSSLTSANYQGLTTEKEGINFTSEVHATTAKMAKKMPGRGDSPIPNVSVSFETFEEQKNTTVIDEEPKIPVAQYRDGTDSNFPEFANISSTEMSDVKSTTEKSHIYTNRISGNDVGGSIKSFPTEHSSRRTNGVFQVFEETPWNPSNSTVRGNKIRKPSISRQPPANNEFWKYIVTSRNVTLATPVASRSTSEFPDRTDETNGSRGGSVKSKKRGSLNTNVEKNFRWFYNVGQLDKDERARKDQLGIHIECGGH